ncbi:hypothetical protein FQN51_008612 [Onygenales sp. PD_10]|nr:hypothetical protein FQN51_008612 [Onygenales sp. PD_10]
MAARKALESSDFYTVGWISPLWFELAAAIAILDEHHNRPCNFVQPLTDTNCYTWGKIGEHNVVIASLPGGEYGPTRAATTASNLMSTFPQIRFGLLVGIGAGIARPERGYDIRLGDVVVSYPEAGTGGVIQYDLGKAKPDQTWERNDPPTMPPLILLQALARLRAYHELGQSRLPEFLEAMPRKKARTLNSSPPDSVYVHQGFENDRLFNSSYTHVSGDGCGGCDEREEVQRDERGSTDPEIHYGIIASGGTLFRDPARRDEIVKDIGEECICFEMEAAGLMRHFPCLVIRGICDYADSHKNDRWQRYAAATAAAYGKELLGYVPARDLQETQRALDFLRSMGQEINKEVRATRSELQEWKQSDESRKILSWLKDTDPGAQLSDFLGRRQAGTGIWFLNDDTFTAWLTGGQQRTLFCPGVPGAGKTIMASIVVDELYRRFQYDEDVGISFLFCNFGLRHIEKPKDMMAGILKQLVRKNDPLPEAVKNLYDINERKGTRPLYDELSIALDSTLSRYSKTFIVADALDEADEAASQVLSTLMELQSRHHIRLLVTSRFVPEITAKFNNSPWLEIRANDDDVEKYVQDQIKQRLPYVAKDSELRTEVINKITKAVDGMFLLAYLHVDSLRGKTRPKAIKAAISKLQSGSGAYDRAYEIAMGRIEGHIDEQVKLAKQTLTWIVCAKRPLSAKAIQHALAVEIGESRFDPDNMPDIDEAISLCVGLVTRDKKSDVVRLVHYTTQEYFERTRDRWLPEGHQYIATTCLTYLAFDAVRDVVLIEDSPTPRERSKGLKVYMANQFLYDYSCRNWGHHARGHSVLMPLIMHLLGDAVKVAACAWPLKMRLSNFIADEKKDAPGPPGGIFVAAYFGLDDVVLAFLEADIGNARLKDQKGRTPLSFAATTGQDSTVELLLNRDADPNLDAHGYSPLLRAISNGHERTAEILLGRGANVCVTTDDSGCDSGISSTKVELSANLRKKPFYSPLSRAVEDGYATIANVLLERGANPNYQNEFGHSPLLVAVRRNNSALVNLLANHGASINIEDSRLRTPLYNAVMHEHGVTVKNLVELGANIHHKDDLGRSPLHLAVEFGKRATVETLVSLGADLLSTDNSGCTPLHEAAVGGHAEIVRLLLECGANPNLSDQYGQTPLSKAILHIHKDVAEKVVELLLERGADPTRKDHKGQSVLSHAVTCRSNIVFQLLLRYEPEVDAADCEGRTPLMKAARSGFEEGVKALLDKGADPNHKDHKRETPLSQAARATDGSGEVVEMLLREGSDPNFKNSDGDTPLILAAERGHQHVVKLLLEQGVEPESIGCYRQTALAKAAAASSTEVVKMLLDNGCDPNFRDKYGETPLSHAISTYSGNETLIKLLLDAGADLNVNNIEGTPILLQAVRADEVFGEDKTQLIKILLENGADQESKDRDGRTALLMPAAYLHDLQTLEVLLQSGADVNSKDKDGRTPFSSAVQRTLFDDDEGLEISGLNLLLEAGADLESRDNQGRTPISWAATQCHLMVRFLLEKGAQPDLRDSDGRTPLSWAASGMGKRCAIFEELLERGADPDSKDDHGRSVLSWVTSRSSDYDDTQKLVKMLLKRGCDPDSVDDNSRNSVSYAACHPAPKIVSLLLENGAQPNLRDNKGRCPFSYATGVESNESTVKILLEKELYPDFKDLNHRTPLSYAAAHKNSAETVKLLLQRGAEPDIRDCNGRTPVSWAAAAGEAETIKLLLRSNVDTNSVDENGRTPLSWAGALCAELLMANGADPNSKDNNGRTPLSWAAARRSCGVAKGLLENGADPNSKDNNGRTPLSWAAAGKFHIQIVKILLDNMSDPNSKDNNGRTPLSWAAVGTGPSSDRNEVVKYLLERTEHPDSKDKSGRSPFFWAAIHGFASAAEILLQNGANPDCPDNEGRTPLLIAKQKGWDRVVKLITGTKDDPDVVDFDDPDADYQIADPEQGLKIYEQFAVEDHVHDIVAELCKIPDAREEFRLGSGVWFDNHADALDEDDEKLSNLIVFRRKSRRNRDITPRGPVESAIIREFQVTIQEGLEDSYLTHGRMDVQLRVPYDDPRTLYYHLGDPGVAERRQRRATERHSILGSDSSQTVVAELTPDLNVDDANSEFASPEQTTSEYLPSSSPVIISPRVTTRAAATCAPPSRGTEGQRVR